MSSSYRAEEMALWSRSRELQPNSSSTASSPNSRCSCSYFSCSGAAAWLPKTVIARAVCCTVAAAAAVYSSGQSMAAPPSQLDQSKSSSSERRGEIMESEAGYCTWFLIQRSVTSGQQLLPNWLQGSIRPGRCSMGRKLQPCSKSLMAANPEHSAWHPPPPLAWHPMQQHCPQTD